MGSIGFIELAGVSALAAMLTLSPQDAAQNGQKQDKKSPDDITVTGCLTASARGDRFVLTPVAKDSLSQEMANRTTDVPPTYTYELSGGTDLRANIGQQVRVTGILDRNFKKDADIDREHETQAAPARPGEPTPKVETKERTELELRRLQVKTINSIGKPCDTPTSS